VRAAAVRPTRGREHRIQRAASGGLRRWDGKW
jgi:hypothetical protein